MPHLPAPPKSKSKTARSEKWLHPPRRENAKNVVSLSFVSPVTAAPVRPGLGRPAWILGARIGEHVSNKGRQAARIGSKMQLFWHFFCCIGGAAPGRHVADFSKSGKKRSPVASGAFFGIDFPLEIAPTAARSASKITQNGVAQMTETVRQK